MVRDGRFVEELSVRRFLLQPLELPSVDRDLVIVCAGDKSLHPHYAAGRRFDLWILYYGDSDARFEEYGRNADRAFKRKGLKVELLRSLIDLHLDSGGSAFDGYRYIVVPDDDIEYPGGSTGIHRLLDAAAAVNADIGQSAVANEYSSPGWDSTRRIAGLFCHATNIVEGMAPVYSGPVFREIVLPGIGALDHLRAGWGLDSYIPKAAEILFRRSVRTFVFDSAPIIHTRPVGQNPSLHLVGRDEATVMPGFTANRIRTYATFATAEEARGFAFPFIKDSTNAAALAAKMAYVRHIRTAALRGVPSEGSPEQPP
jgi:hypothetical protein